MKKPNPTKWKYLSSILYYVRHPTVLIYYCPLEVGTEFLSPLVWLFIFRPSALKQTSLKQKQLRDTAQMRCWPQPHILHTLKRRLFLLHRIIQDATTRKYTLAMKASQWLTSLYDHYFKRTCIYFCILTLLILV